MTNVGARDPDRWKPEGFKHFKTSGELARIVNRDLRLIKRLESEGRIGKPITVKCGRLHVRLYSPDEVDTIQKYIEAHGRGKHA